MQLPLKLEAYLWTAAYFFAPDGFSKADILCEVKCRRLGLQTAVNCAGH